jgi:hypothetical protein
MKKILLSLTIISSLFLVSCEDEFAPENEENFENETNDSIEITDSDYGYWDYTCKTVYDSIAVINCDSSIIYYNSNMQSNNQGNDSVGIWAGNDSNIVICQPFPCVTTYEIIQKEICDSVWVEHNGNWCGTVWDADSLGNNTITYSVPTGIIVNNMGN